MLASTSLTFIRPSSTILCCHTKCSTVTPLKHHSVLVPSDLEISRYCSSAMKLESGMHSQHLDFCSMLQLALTHWTLESHFMLMPACAAVLPQTNWCIWGHTVCASASAPSSTCWWGGIPIKSSMPEACDIIIASPPVSLSSAAELLSSSSLHVY